MTAAATRSNAGVSDAPPFAPRLDVLTPPQRRLWDELGDVPDGFTLYGGTGPALHLGHRQSVDFDFFGDRRFDPADLLDELPFGSDAEVTLQQADTLSVRVDRGGLVALSFFGVPEIGRVRAPLSAGGAVASALDIAGMKACVVTRRADVKDYRDIAALLRGGVSLPEVLAAGRVIDGSRFVPEIALRARSFYGDGDVARLPAADRGVIAAAVAADPRALPDLRPVRPRRDR